MARVNVFLSDQVLKAIDAQAAASQVNRSALIQSVLVTYLETLPRERKEAQERRDMEEAGRGMDALAEKLGDWDPVGVIRSFRDERSFGAREPRARDSTPTLKRRS